MTNILRIPLNLIRPFYEMTSIHKGVITELEDQTLQRAYSHCRAITREYAKTFYMATRFLPYSKQRSIFAIYGLCRYLDNLVDEAEDLTRREYLSRLQVIEKLDEFTHKLINVYRGAPSNDPILIAFSHTLNYYNIPIELPLQLIDGVKMDLTKNRYETFDEVYDYSYKVASVVGLMTSEVFGYSDPRALNYAVDLGIAMQLTNILRDIGEDIDNNRIYLPNNEMNDFGITEEMLMRKEMTPAFASFMKFQIKRAHEYYERSDVGISMLSRDSRLPVALARENYSRILSKIEENEYNVFAERAYLNSTEKFSILPKVYMQIRR
ncbi:MAG: phytoene/squalene synthase family protein [Balneolaceae bacterium]